MGRALRGPVDPTELLPLTDLAFNILLALKGEELHGYALIKALRARTGREGLRTGTVYAALARLEEGGLLSEVEDEDGEDTRRRSYRLTDLGLATARAEARRLREILLDAASKDLISDLGGG